MALVQLDAGMLKKANRSILTILHKKLTPNESKTSLRPDTLNLIEEKVGNSLELLAQKATS